MSKVRESKTGFEAPQEAAGQQKSGGPKAQDRQAKKAAREAKTADRTASEQAPGQSAKRRETMARLESLAASIAAPAGLEIVEIEWKGSGRNQLLRIYIDKPEGVTHADCELVSHGMSAVLDAEDPISGSYELEVSSPGVERKLNKWADWQRFTGQKVKVVLKEPVDEMKFFEGTIFRVEAAPAEAAPAEAASAEAASVEAAPAAVPPSSATAGGSITLDLTGGRMVTFAFSQVDRANLKFEW